MREALNGVPSLSSLKTKQLEYVLKVCRYLFVLVHVYLAKQYFPNVPNYSLPQFILPRGTSLELTERFYICF